MWFKAETKEQLYDALASYQKKWMGEYISGKEQFVGAGWYWLEVRKMYFGSCTDHVVIALPAETRIGEIKEEIKELTDKLVEARKTVRG